MIIISKYVVPHGYLGLTIWPFIFLKTKSLKHNSVLVNHERIHIRQQIDMLILPFFIWYALEFVIRLVQFKSWHLAYRAISFEKEAYQHENDADYLKSRVFWGIIKYL